METALYVLSHGEKKKISWIMAQEKMVRTLQDTTRKFDVPWEPWATYL